MARRAGAAPWLVFVLLLSTLVWGARQGPHPAAFLPPADGPCRPQEWTLQNERYPRSLRSTPQGTVLTLPAVLSRTVCGPGTLTVQASSAGRGPVPPVVSVSLNGRPALSRVVEGRQTLSVTLTAPTRVTVAFLNQAYALDLRALDLLQLLPRGAGPCPDLLQGQVPEDSGAWHPSTASGRLFGSAPLTLNTCGARQVHLRVKGQAAGGQWPQLQVGGLAQELDAPLTVRGVQTFTFDLNPDKPLSLRLINPLLRETVNSRLQVATQFRAP